MIPVWWSSVDLHVALCGGVVGVAVVGVGYVLRVEAGVAGGHPGGPGPSQQTRHAVPGHHRLLGLREVRGAAAHEARPGARGQPGEGPRDPGLPWRGSWRGHGNLPHVGFVVQRLARIHVPVGHVGVGWHVDVLVVITCKEQSDLMIRNGKQSRTSI